MKLSIVILNWNGRLLLKKFLPKIILYTPNTPIYVVDNASEDDSIEFLKKEYKQIILIKLNRNIGYSKAYNHVELCHLYILLSAVDMIIGKLVYKFN